MDIFLLGTFSILLCSYFNRDYRVEGQFMMLTELNPHNPGSFPRISCPRAPAWPWVNLSVSVPSVWVFGASWCHLSPIFMSACHRPCNCLHFCKSVLKASGLYLRKLRWALLFLNFWKFKIFSGAHCFWTVYSCSAWPPFALFPSAKVAGQWQSCGCTIQYQRQLRHTPALRWGTPAGRRWDHGVWMVASWVDTLHSSTASIQMFTGSSSSEEE